MQYYIDTETKQRYGFEDGNLPLDMGHLQPISLEEVQKQVEAEQQALFDKLSYSTKRRREYPSIGDQLDALYHAGIFPAEMAAKIAEVKAKYPK